jgi:hypothetical protein
MRHDRSSDRNHDRAADTAVPARVKDGGERLVYPESRGGDRAGVNRGDDDDVIVGFELRLGSRHRGPRRAGVALR